MPGDDTSDEAWLTASRLHRLPSSHESGPGCGTVEQHSSSGLDQLHAHHVNNLPPAILHGIFGHLGPRDLCVVSATCQLWRKLNQDKAANGVWKRFYTSRWRVLGCSSQEDVCWQTKYGSKMKEGKSWSGKYESDNLWGHKAGVKALKLLPSHGVLLTGSLDRTIRLWDLTYGMPLSISRPHGGTVRAVALDHALVASGSSDNVIRLWHARHSTDGSTLLDPAEASAAAAEAGITAMLPRMAADHAISLETLDRGLAESLMELDGPADTDAQHTAIDQTPGGLTAAAVAAVNASSSRARRPGRGPYSVVTGEADEGLFDLTMPGQHLRGHIGPVTSLCLTDSCLYSGSWDYTVRVWRRGSWDCVSVLKYPDWVYSVVARGGLLLVASGPEVHVHDLPTGKLVRKFQNLHEVSVSCLEGTHSGRLLFSGGADGLLMAHDLRMKEPSRVLWHHNAGVNGLALEDPWLVSTASDGTVIMHNLETALPNNFSGCVGPGSSFLSSTTSSSSTSASSSSKRTLGCPGQSGPMYCVDMAESWLAAGGESPAVRTWDFTRAAEAAARAAAARAARGSSKKGKSRRAAAAAAGEREAAAAAPAAANERQVTKRGGKGSRAVGDSSSAARHSPAAASGSWAAAVSGASAVQGTCSSSSSSSSTGTRLPRGLLAAAAAAAAAGAANADAVGSNAPSGSSDSSRADRFHKLQSRRSSKRLVQHDVGGSSSGGGGSGSDGAAGAEGALARTSVDKAVAGSFLAAAAAAGSTAAAHDRCSTQANRHSSSGTDRAAGITAAPEGGFGSYGSSPQGRGYRHGQQHGSSGGWHGSSPVQHGAWLGGSSPPLGSSRLHHSSSSGRRHSSNGSTPVPNSHLPGQQQQVAGGRSGIAIPAGKHAQQHHRRPAAHTDAAPAGGYDAAWGPYGASPRSSGAGGFDAAATAAYPAAAAAAGQPSRGVMYGGSPAGGTAGESSGDRCHRGSYPAPAAYQVPFSSSYPSAAQGPGPWLVPGSTPRYEVWGTTLRIAAARNTDKRLAIKRPEAAARRSGDGAATSSRAAEAEEGLVAGSFSN